MRHGRAGLVHLTPASPPDKLARASRRPEPRKLPPRGRHPKHARDMHLRCGINLLEAIVDAVLALRPGGRKLEGHLTGQPRVARLEDIAVGGKEKAVASVRKGQQLGAGSWASRRHGRPAQASQRSARRKTAGGHAQGWGPYAAHHAQLPPGVHAE